MSLNACPECWDSVCACGYQYAEWNEEDIADFLTGLLQYHDLHELAEILGKRTLTHSSIIYGVLRLIKEIEDK